MSEMINNNIQKTDDLVAYAKGILQGERGIDLYNQYEKSLKAVTPIDVLHVVDELVKTNEDMRDIKRAVNKILNIFYLPVKNHGKADVEHGSFLHYLMEENREMEKRIEVLKIEIKRIFKHKEPRKALLQSKDELKVKILDLQEYDKHNLKKENILFPYFEKALPEYRCVNVMWSMHDDARQSLNRLVENLERELPLI
ncbi:MAG: hypothetical protein K8R68_04660, partial [Bacteroidales bacterium]|nr:hypothetical protein [Bacteroidales bacterium]